MGAITIVAVFQEFLKYPDFGTKLMSLTHNQIAYSATLILSTLSAGGKSATYFFHKTTSMLKRKKQRKQLLMVVGAMIIIYFLPVITQVFHQYFG